MKKLLILSGKGGTGKTTTAAAFIKFSNATAFADCDVDAPNLHIVSDFSCTPEEKSYIGSKKASIDTEKCIKCGACAENCNFNAIDIKDNEYSVNEYSCEGCGVCEHICPQNAITLSDDVAGEMFLYKQEKVLSTAKLKMGRGNSGKLVTEVKFALANNTDKDSFAIIDGSPGIGCPVIASISGCDLVLIVAEPSLSGISDMERIIRTAQSFGANIAVCVNKYDTSIENAEKIKEFCNLNNINFTGYIPYDKLASKAINEGKSIAEIDCPMRDALFEVYNNTMKLI